MSPSCREPAASGHVRSRELARNAAARCAGVRRAAAAGESGSFPFRATAAGSLARSLGVSTSPARIAGWDWRFWPACQWLVEGEDEVVMVDPGVDGLTGR